MREQQYLWRGLTKNFVFCVNCEIFKNELFYVCSIKLFYQIFDHINNGNWIKLQKLHIDIKMEIDALSALNLKEDWATFWITSYDNNNIKIGIGNMIGNENDILFSFKYEYIDFNLLYEPLKYVWIDSPQETEWIFYDYSNSSLCNENLLNKYNITQNI